MGVTIAVPTPVKTVFFIVISPVFKKIIVAEKQLSTQKYPTAVSYYVR
jgi:hypothetical protein